MKKRLGLLLTLFSFLSACSSYSPNIVSVINNTTNNKSTDQAFKHHEMVCIAPNIYVDKKMSTAKRAEFLQTVAQSRKSISSFFGGMKSNPNIYACTTNACLKHFGGVPSKAKAIDDDKVLLSLSALNKVTLSHELAHVELHKRLGKAQLWNKIPMWFDEGLAVLACQDPSYKKPVKMMPLMALKSQAQWVNAARDHKPIYSIAKQAVEKWYRVAGLKGLQAMIKQMQQGDSFSRSFENSLPAKHSLQISHL